MWGAWVENKANFTAETPREKKEGVRELRLGTAGGGFESAATKDTAGEQGA
jgi:hypothetical protein